MSDEGDQNDGRHHTEVSSSRCSEFTYHGDDDQDSGPMTRTGLVAPSESASDDFMFMPRRTFPTICSNASEAGSIRQDDDIDDPILDDLPRLHSDSSAPGRDNAQNVCDVSGRFRMFPVIFVNPPSTYVRPMVVCESDVDWFRMSSSGLRREYLTCLSLQLVRFVMSDRILILPHLVDITIL